MVFDILYTLLVLLSLPLTAYILHFIGFETFLWFVYFILLTMLPISGCIVDNVESGR